MEFKLNNKLRELEKIKGPGYAKQSQGEKFASDINEKKKKVKKFKKELTEYTDEIAVLNRSQAIVNKNRGEIEQQVRELERKYGVTGFTNMLQNQNEVMENMLSHLFN